MPSRTTALVILGFWLATTGWLVYREYLPRFHTDEPPPYAIHLADEAPKKPGGRLATYWRVVQKDADEREHDVGRAWTWVEYDAQDDAFRLECRIKFMPRVLLLGSPAMMDDPPHIRNWYTVTRDGDLIFFHAETVQQDAGLVEPTVFNLEGVKPITVEGAIKDGYFEGAWFPGGEAEAGSQELEPVPVSKRGSVLNPLQPLQRQPDLYVGQRWRTPYLDLLSAARSGKRPELQMAEARVTEADLPRSHRGPIHCLVVEYRSSDPSFLVRTWVRADDDVVVQQDVSLPGSQLTLRRSQEH